MSYAARAATFPTNWCRSSPPGHRENINFFGFISVDIEAELAKLIEGWRPLRPTTVTESGTSFMLSP